MYRTHLATVNIIISIHLVLYICIFCICILLNFMIYMPIKICTCMCICIIICICNCICICIQIQINFPVTYINKQFLIHHRKKAAFYLEKCCNVCMCYLGGGKGISFPAFKKKNKYLSKYWANFIISFKKYDFCTNKANL